MAVNFYSCADDSAPILSGTAGSLVGVLKACLVDGYGSKSSAGWTMPFYDAASHTAVFKLGGDQNKITYLQINDNWTGTNGFRIATVYGYEDMISFDTGTGPYGSTYWLKSYYLDSNAKGWYILADERRFYYFSYAHSTLPSINTANYNSVYGFGEFISNKENDQYNYFLFGGPNATSEHTNGLIRNNSCNAIDYYTWICRSYTGVGGSVYASSSANKWGSYGSIMNNWSIPYPFPVDGGLLLTKTNIHELNVPRGEIPGLWHPMHSSCPFSHLSTYSIVDGAKTRSFIALQGQYHFYNLEISDTWDL